MRSCFRRGKQKKRLEEDAEHDLAELSLSAEGVSDEIDGSPLGFQSKGSG